LKALSPADTGFLLLEKRHQPMHVGGLFLARPPKNAPSDYLERIAERMRLATKPTAPFDKQLTRKLGAWFWERDEQFDIDHHFRHYALPRPGRIRELLRMVSQLHAAPLDRARPLWELYLIDGVDDGRFAIYSKIHHSLVDGVAAMRILQRCLSEDPDELDMQPPWSALRSPKERKELENPSGIRELLSSVPKVTREVARTIREVRKDDDRYNDLRAPRCIFNQGISGSRRFAAQSYALDRIRAVGRSHRATVNDVVLAMCASALRRYLLDLGELPEKPLIAMVPMSIRRDDSSDGNQIAMILANLGTHLSDPSARLRTVQKSVQQAKDRYSRMTPGEILAYVATLLGPAGLNFLTSAVPRVQAFNVIISNVPGPKSPLYFNGARIEGMYPVSIVVDGQALNLTLTSYVDKLEFGVIACRRTLPRIQRLLDYLEDGLTELEGMHEYNELP
jgi:diacylglycerol O-acyltransferase / wax synthase